MTTTTALTRESCIECVDKHLGAAMILIGEVRAGYEAHRLRAIGHLHEAEDESQAWPTLHDTIRTMRKDFQQHGTPPDFELLATLSRNARMQPAGLAAPRSVALGAPTTAGWAPLPSIALAIAGIGVGGALVGSHYGGPKHRWGGAAVGGVAAAGIATLVTAFILNAARSAPPAAP